MHTSGNLPRASLGALFNPRAIAVYGASSDPTKIGGRPLDFLKSSGYDGPLYPINPKSAEIQGLPAFATVSSVPGPVDMAIVAVPAPSVFAALEDCAAKGLGGAVVLSSGFAEVGGPGVQWQQQITELTQRTGMRVVGPNCMGIINVRRRILGTFTPSAAGFGLAPGRISLVSQSGAFGGYCLSLIRQRGLGLNLWITTGNQCDVDFADCVNHYALDDGTDVIMGYVEAATNKDRLVSALALARERGKRIVLMKVGSSEAGAQATASHTASLAGSDQVYDGLFKQYGVYRARTIDELFDVAYACSLARQPPKGKRVGLLTVSGGVGALMADVATECGLDVAPMPEDAQRRLKEILPFAGTRNPVDMTAQLVNDLTLFERNFDLLLAEGGYDVVVAFLSSVGQVLDLSSRLLDQLKLVLQRFPDRTIIMSMLATPEVRKLYEAANVMLFDEPTRAVRAASALAYLAAESERGKSLSAPPPLPAAAQAPPGQSINEVDAKRILASAGIPVVRERLAASEDDAAAFAAELGFPVVLKIASADIAHKSEIGGVLLGLQDESQVREGFRTLQQRAHSNAPQARLDGVVVAGMAARGVETILGVTRDPVFGAVVMFGLGGIFVEAFKDVSFRIAPFGIDEAHRMIDEVKGRILLTGLRGQPPADEEALAQALSQLSVYAALHADDIDSIDINPFVVLPRGQGALALDALIVPRNHAC
ncbi:acetate--CoA ligase family protein [Piscinibacter sakaiensis]|uniref:acetate--CoA ligase family protein n=1 Tax=Piscinibacter sakaiensis TaxID=1547922 RepID=UPI003AAB2B16